VPAAGQPGVGQVGRPNTGVSPTDWRVLLLKALRAPVNSTNLDTLQAWALSESGFNRQSGTALAGPSARNPLAITDSFGVPTIGTHNSAGVLRFGSTIAGVMATARFMQHGYQPVIQGFRDSSPEEVYQAVNGSGWCSGCQAGRYPIGLYNYVQTGRVQGGGLTFDGGGLTFSQAEQLASSGGSSKTDTGGLFGYCKVTSSSIPLGPSIPTGGFGCYVSQSLIFGAVGFGGVVLMLLGAYFLVSPGMRSKILSVPLAGAGVAAGLGGLEAAGAAKTAAGVAPAARKGRLSDDERAQRERHAAAQRRARIRVDRGKAREAEARAREAEGRSRASSSSSTRPSSSGRLAYETPGYD
jgi:hypothetical protein